jgi:hypothetical protein
MLAAACIYLNTANADESPHNDPIMLPATVNLLFTRFENSANSICNDSPQSTLNMTADECVNRTIRKIPKCRHLVRSKFSSVIHTKSQLEKFAREYLYCIVPGYMCSGVEVKNKDMANELCPAVMDYGSDNLS